MLVTCEIKLFCKCFILHVTTVLAAALVATPLQGDDDYTYDDVVADAAVVGRRSV